MQPLRSRIQIIILLAVMGVNARAQQADSLQQRLAVLRDQFNRSLLSDTAYLNAVDSAAPLLVKEDSLPELLSDYRQIAFADPRWGAYRAKYYTYLAFYSYNANRYGSAIFYSEKNQEERVKAGMNEREGIPRSDLFAMTVNYNNRDYARVFAKYKTLRPLLEKLPAAVPAGKLSRDQAYIVLAILNSVVYSAYKTGDTSLGNEGIGITKNIRAAIRLLPGKYKTDTTLYNYIYHTMCYTREKYRDGSGRGEQGRWDAGPVDAGHGDVGDGDAVRDHYRLAQKFLQTAIREVRSGEFPPNYRPAYTEELFGDAFDFYFDHGKMDSARFYLARVRAMNDSLVKFSSMERSFLLESSSKLLAAGGDFRRAYGDLLKVYQVKDSAFYATSSDKDNNLYAMAEEENTHRALLLTETKKQQAERSTLLLSILLSFLVLGGIAGFLIYRSRQRQRQLNWQLHLARNFHDEIGPLLLYANILLKKEAASHPSDRMEELKGQLSNIMETVRGISHDLKSNTISTVGSFHKEITSLLEKIKASTRIDFTIRINNGNRVLNHWQYTHLSKMLNELIGNSIKHAECSRIAVGIETGQRDLRISYSDDGKGMEPGGPVTGIGMKNIKERTALLKGIFQLNNAWPRGYSIDISIPLV